MFKKILMVLAIISFSFFFVSLSHAWDYALEDVGKGGGYKTSGSESELLTIVNTSVTIGLSLIAVIFLAMMFYAGLRWMTARGNEELVERARNTLIAAAIGFIIVVASYGISRFIFEQMARSGTGNSCVDAGGVCGEISACPKSYYDVTKDYACSKSSELCCYPMSEGE